MTTAAWTSVPLVKEPESKLVHQIGHSTSGTIDRIIILGDLGISVDRPMGEIEYPEVGTYSGSAHALSNVRGITLNIEANLGTYFTVLTRSFLGSTEGTPFEPLDRVPIHTYNFILGRKDFEWVPEAILERLNYLAQLPQNWDKDGSASINPTTIARARTVLSEAFRAGAQNLSLPSIAPAYDGMLVMEWSSGAGKELTIDVPANDEPCGFLLVEPQLGGGEIEIDEEFGSEWTVTAVIQRLLGP